MDFDTFNKYARAYLRVFFYVFIGFIASLLILVGIGYALPTEQESFYTIELQSDAERTLAHAVVRDVPAYRDWFFYPERIQMQRNDPVEWMEQYEGQRILYTTEASPAGSESATDSAATEAEAGRASGSIWRIRIVPVDRAGVSTARETADEEHDFVSYREISFEAGELEIREYTRFRSPLLKVLFLIVGNRRLEDFGRALDQHLAALD